MTIDFHKSFTKQAKALKPAQKDRLKQALLLFEAEPYHHLYNHPLRGQWAGHRSIPFGGDWRAHYIEKGRTGAVCRGWNTCSIV